MLWIAARGEKLLPVGHFHAVFTGLERASPARAESPARGVRRAISGSQRNTSRGTSTEVLAVVSNRVEIVRLSALRQPSQLYVVLISADLIHLNPSVLGAIAKC